MKWHAFFVDVVFVVDRHRQVVHTSIFRRVWVQRVRGSLLLIILLPVGVWSVCSEWKTWVIIALDLSAVAPSLNLIYIPPLI